MKINEEIVLKHLDDFGLDIFSLKELDDANILEKRNLRYVINRLISNNYIDVIERGKYCRHNFKDHFVIGCFVIPDGIISYWNAINYHGLSEQIPNIVLVKTSKRKKNAEYFGVRYIFSQKQKNCMSGYIEEGYGNHKFRISNKERTIVDAFDRPRISGGYAEIIKAFYRAKLNAKKMIRYCIEENNLSLVKRLAYLADLLEKPNMDTFIQYARSILNEKYSLFEIDGETVGKTNKEWRLILNIPEEEIIEMARS